MLVIERELEESIVIRHRGEEIRIKLIRVSVAGRPRAWNGFEGPRSFEVIRSELADTWQRPAVVTEFDSKGPESVE